MRLAFQIYRLSDQPLGQQIYMENVLKALLLGLPEDWDVSVCASGLKGRTIHRQRRKIVDPQLRARWSLLPVPVTIQNWLMDHTSHSLCPPEMTRADIVHSLGGGSVSSAIENMLCTVQDVIPLRLNEGTPEFVERVRIDLSRLVRQAVNVVTISEFSKREIADVLDVDPGKIVVIPNGVDQQRFRQPTESEISSGQERLSQLGIRRPYLLHLGGGAARKNAGRAISAFEILKERYRIPHSLVLAGAASLPPDVRDKIGASRFASEIVVTGYLSDSDALRLLQLADALVFSSTYEGFGLPPLEAMACGVPVALSNAASLPEVGGDATVYFDPLNVEDIVDSIYKLIEDQSLRQSNILKGLARSKTFTWEHNARSTINLYKDLSAQAN